MSSWQLTVKGLQGNAVVLEVTNPQQLTILDLKRQIHQKEPDIPPFEQRLVHLKQELEDSHTLSSYPDIQNGSTVFLVRLVPFQLFVIDLDGKTHTIKVPSTKPETYSVAHLKKLVYEKTGVTPDEQRLQYGGKQLEDRKTLADYNIQNQSNIHLVVRLRGGLATPTKVGMPCGHSTSPTATLGHCMSELKRNKTEIQCPYCSTEWSLQALRKYSGLSSTQLQTIEELLTQNFCLQAMPGVMQCQGCGSLCKQSSSSSFKCPSCLKKQQMSGDSATVKLLSEAPVKTVGHATSPAIRACPQCGKLIEHNEGCRRVTCNRCNTDFCFVCLKIRPSGTQPYYPCPDNCSPAPRQTYIPKY